MNTNFTYQLFTFKDLKDWLVNGVSNGLSDSIIARSRAWAWVNNPHALPEDVVLAVVYDDNNQPIGYTGAYAEEWVKPAFGCRYFWGSTQWMDPQFRGKGISWNMMRLIKDAVDDRYIALDSSPASCRLDEKQGYKILYYPKYYFVLHSPKRKSFKSWLKDKYVSIFNGKIIKSLSQYRYENRYVKYIDDESYSFIVSHSDKDLFLRKQDFLNWQLRFPFLIDKGTDNRVNKELCEFGGYANRVQIRTIQVFVDKQMAGIYTLCIINNICTVWYLYYAEDYRNNVFASIVSAMYAIEGIEQFRTFSKSLFDFMVEHGMKSMHSKHSVIDISLTIPCDFEVDTSLQIQGGDGDMLV